MKRKRIGWISLAAMGVVLPLILRPMLFAAAGDPPARVARLSFIQGVVSLQPSGENDWSEASLNYPLTTGDRIYTDQDSHAEIEVGSVTIRASETTDLTVANLDDQLIQLGLAQGTIRVRVHDLPAGNSLEVDTPNGALTLLQPGDYRVEVFPTDDATLVIVTNGSLEVSGGGVEQSIESGQAVKLTGTDPIQVSITLPPGPDGFDEWGWERDDRYASSVSANYVNQDTPGYEDLDTYGTWDGQTPYGPVWYPAGVAIGWVPYRVGRWVWIVPWGWTWVESEPWGFVPLHYGRWVFFGEKWGWVPGPITLRPIYAPALVAFLGGPNLGNGSRGGGIQAWFPLGPGEPFFPWYHYSNAYLQEVNAANLQHAPNIDALISTRNASNIRFANENLATTAVSSEAFCSGQPVDRQTIRVDSEQLAKVEIIPHPGVNPTERALGGGRLVSIPPRIATHPRVPPRPQGVSPASGESPPSRFITRTPLPPPRVPFSVRQPALQAHPGRPLEPQQEENLRAGRPAGPMRDSEYPPHPAPAPAPKPETRETPRVDSGHHR